MMDYRTLNDTELAELISAGDSTAFKQIYIRYWDTLLDYAYRRVDSIDAAEELVQDLFVEIYLKRESLRVKTTFEGYLKNALKFKVFDVFRSQQTRDRYLTSMLSESGVTTLSPDHQLQLKELSQRIERSTQRMPERCREVFLLSRMENLSHKSIAEKLNISISTVEKHISKATGILKGDFPEYHLEVVIFLFCLLAK